MPRPATAADLPQLADVLADAFSDYAWTNWTVPAQDRHQRIRTLQLLYLRHAGLPHGMVWTVPDRTAVAVFLPAGLPPLPPAVLAQITDAHGDRLEALEEAEELVAAHRPAHDWVLATVGVAPTAQGHGLGRTVVSAGLETIDGQGGTCLLETSDPRNHPFYQRLGFSVGAVVSPPRTTGVDHDPHQLTVSMHFTNSCPRPGKRRDKNRTPTTSHKARLEAAR